MKKTVKCPRCGSDEITAHGLVIGYSTIVLKTWEVDDVVDDAEPYGDIDDIDDFTCSNCDFNFDDDGDEIKRWWETGGDNNA